MKPRPEKKPSLHHILPMELQVGDRLADETGEWEVIGRPYMSAGGKNAHVGYEDVSSGNTGHAETVKIVFSGAALASAEVGSPERRPEERLRRVA